MRFSQAFSHRQQPYTFFWWSRSISPKPLQWCWNKCDAFENFVVSWDIWVSDVSLRCTSTTPGLRDELKLQLIMYIKRNMRPDVVATAEAAGHLVLFNPPIFAPSAHWNGLGFNQNERSSTIQYMDHATGSTATIGREILETRWRRGVRKSSGLLGNCIHLSTIQTRKYLKTMKREEMPLTILTSTTSTMEVVRR